MNKKDCLILWIFSVLLSLILLSCGGGGGGTSESNPTAPPSAPATLQALEGNAQVMLSWETVNGATGYNVYRSMTAGAVRTTGVKITGMTSPCYQDSLTNGTVYYYVVTATNQYGESADSPEVSAMPRQTTPPLPPKEVRGLAANQQAIIRWTAADPFDGNISHNIYWSTQPDVSKANGIKVSNVASPYTFSDLTNGTAYYYVVTSSNQFGESPDSAAVSITPEQGNPPPVPTGVSAEVASDSVIVIRWDTLGAATSAASGTTYNLYWSLSSDVSKGNGTKIAGVESPYAHRELIAGNTYYYVVTAENEYGESVDSARAYVTIPNEGSPPPAPTGVRVVTASETVAVIYWETFGEATNAVSGTTYNLYWSFSADVSKVSGTKIGGVQSPYAHRDLTPGTTYYYVVTAENEYGESVESARVYVTMPIQLRDLCVAMGDSITVGFGASSYDKSYVPLLAAQWGKTVVNRGVSGSHSSYGAAIIDSVLNEYNPRYVTIYFGTNDAGFFDPDYTITNLRYIVQRAKAYGTTPIIATLGPCDGDWSWRRSYMLELSQRIRQLARNEGIACADIDAALGWNSGYLTADGLHPNDAGYGIIANTFYSAVPQ